MFISGGKANYTAGTGLNISGTNVISIPNNGVSQNGYAQITAAITTTSASFVDATGLTTTITTSGNTGSFVFVMASGDQYNSGANTNHFQLMEDTTAIANNENASANSEPSVVLHSIRTPSGASHTYKLQWSTGAGTATLARNGDTQTSAQISAIELKR